MKVTLSIGSPSRTEYPYLAALLIAAFLGFEGTWIALGATDPPAALRVEMAKPPHCSIKTPDRLFFL